MCRNVIYSLYIRDILYRFVCPFVIYSWVGIVTDYGLDNSVSNPSWDEIFCSSRPTLGPTQPPVKWAPGLSRGVNCGRGMLLTTHLLLASRSWKSKAIPLPTLWAISGL